ncbi:hypothetical protein [Rhodobacter ferrooxidans]|uniref:Uncharacterized protein n=1 Tax=Rhodobacter ferrooxidans TaxID=371731 RepID=C8RXZ3_9RHOB|nr:hypothetical protein [Rhodobacter sp. SW2]EEW26391.1 hypothetical protein Rsw2DRAFT_0671 [Rhodobacter sp. SW2]
MKHLWQTHRWLVLAFLVAASLSMFFGIRAALFVPRWHLHLDYAAQPVQPWMTPKLIVKTYGVPPEVLEQVLGLPEKFHPRQTLAEIAADQGIDSAALAARVEAAVRAARGHLQQ